MPPILEFIADARDELLTFALFGFAVGGIDDLIVDMLWLSHWVAKRLGKSPLAVRSCLEMTEGERGKIAIFVPAWREAAVIADMLRLALDS